MKFCKSACLALALVAASCIAMGLSTTAHAQTKIAFGITSYVSGYVSHFIALDKKFYEAEHLTVETIAAGSAANVIQQLGAGSLDIAQAATNQTLRAIMKGAPITIVCGAVSSAPFRVLGAKGIHGWSDLKGKKISVGGPTDQTLYFFRIMARKNGLADGDYDLLYAGGTPERFAHLLSGAVGAAVLTNPLDFTAIEQGYVDLGTVPSYLPNWAQNNVETSVRWAEKNRDALIGFIRAYAKATEYFYDPKNRDDVIRILIKYAKNEPKAAADTYDFYIKEKVIARNAALFEDGIQANLDAFVELGELKSAPALKTFIDPQFLAKATQ